MSTKRLHVYISLITDIHVAVEFHNIMLIIFEMHFRLITFYTSFHDE